MAIKVPDVLASFGVDLGPLLAAEGVAEDVFSDPDHALPFVTFCGLISRCAAAVARDDFGLLVCEAASASNLGLVGFLLQQAPDVRTALTDLVGYLHHHDRGAAPFLVVEHGTACLGYAIHEPHLPATAQIHDGALATALNIMRALCGAQWTLLEVTLTRPRPASPARYERFFDAPVTFGSDRDALYFPESCLATPIPRADPALRRMLEEQVELLEREEVDNVSEQTRRLLRAALLTSLGSLDEICRMLGMSRRTFARRLTAEGTTFKRIADEVRFDLARHLLGSTAMSATEIGAIVRFSEASAFSRAFKGWSGMTPREWRLRYARSSGGMAAG
ncbi:AraC family transcriptional regulator [Chelatococcus reniformis]|uniref:AraC family transcriptional regulator n=1 Tax=Chelatococcus reniformis TaxID=1494448 RepID=A0A916U9Q1_9HYPH|nr:AraC family transcriptional regulator [Chelatococcus reniformis]